MSEWISLKDREPDVNVEVLTTDGDEMAVASKCKWDIWFIYDDTVPQWQPTHWMPLPEPPKC